MLDETPSFKVEVAWHALSHFSRFGVVKQQRSLSLLIPADRCYRPAATPTSLDNQSPWRRTTARCWAVAQRLAMGR